MKTIREYLKKNLTPEEYKLACKYESFGGEWDEVTSYDFESAMEEAFDWHLTDEGDDYWRSVADRVADYWMHIDDRDNTEDICEKTIISLSEEVEGLKEEIKKLASTIRLASKWLSTAGMEGEYKMLESIAKEYEE